MLTKPQARALEILAKQKTPFGGLWPSAFARLMWPDSPSWKRHSNCGPNGSRVATGIYFKAGAFLQRLRTLGYARGWTSECGQWMYRISVKGEKALEEYRKK